MEQCRNSTLVDLLSTFNDKTTWTESLDRVDLVHVEESLLEFVRILSTGVTRVSSRVSGEQIQVQQRNRLPERSYAEEFPSLGSSLGDTKKSILEARIASPSGRVQTLTKTVSKRRIVPTAVASVHVDETFVNVEEDSVEKVRNEHGESQSTRGEVADHPQTRGWSVYKGMENHVDEDIMCTPDQTGKGLTRLPAGGLSERFGSLGFDSFGGKSPVVRPAVEEDMCLPEWKKGLAILHARVLERSPRILLLSEISFLFELLVMDPQVKIDREDGFQSGMEAVVYAGTVLQHCGDLLHGLGRDILENLSGFLMSFATKSNVLQSLQKAVDTALFEQEPASLMHSPSLGRVQNSGPLLGLTGLNVFLNDSSGVLSRSSDDQKKISNRETFRDTWFKVMRDAVHRSSSLDALQQHKGAAKVENNAVSEEQHGDLVVLKIIQEDSGQLLRGLRVDNYDFFAELFTAAVLQAAVTGETLMDEELTGIAKQNLSRFESLNKRFQMTSNAKGARPARRFQHKAVQMARKGHVDHSAEHALRISREFSKPLRPFVLFLEATDSHRLNNSLAKIMITKLVSLLKSSREATSLKEAGLLSLEELCISTTSLAGFLGYFSFTKGQGVSNHSSPSLQKVQERGDFDGSHYMDVWYAFQQCVPIKDNTSSTQGNIFRYIPWICRYLSFLSWNRELCKMPYFRRLFSMIYEMKCHPYLQPKSEKFHGIAPLCLRGMLDNFCWYFEPEMEGIREAKHSTHVDCSGALGIAIEDDIQWANTVLGRRYLEMTCPDISYLQALISPAKPHGQEVKTRKKIRPTVPLQHKAVSSPLSPGVKNGREPPEASSAEYRESKVIEELERVFLDQYSNGSLVTDVKLRDFVSWCSDAVARQGVSAGLEQIHNQRDDEISNNIQDKIAEYKQGGTFMAERMDKQRLQLVTQEIEDQFSASYYRVLQSAALSALREKIKQCSKHSAAILLPDSWGIHVKMTAAAIIARRAESAGMRQLKSELKKVSLSRTKKEMESLIY